MAFTSNYDDTTPTHPAALLDDLPTLVIQKPRIERHVPGLHPLAVIGAMIAGALMWAGFFLVIHWLIQIF